MKKTINIFLASGLLLNLLAAPLNAAAQDGTELFQASENGKAGTITVRQAVDMALAENINIKIAQKNAEIYNQEVRQYWSYVYPHIKVGANYTRALKKMETIIPALGGKIEMGTTNTASANAEATLLLWKGGAVAAGIRGGRYHSQSGYMQLEAVRNQIKDSVMMVCFGIILSKALIRVQQENLNIAQNHLKEIELKYKQGLASDLDVLNQKVKISNNEPPVIQAKNAYEIGLLTLRRMLNKDPQEPMDLSWQQNDIMLMMQRTPPDLEKLFPIAVENRPDLAAARLNTKLAAEFVKIARADHFGEINAFANTTYNGGSDSVLIPVSDYNSSYGATAGLRLSLPLFEGWRTASIVKQRKLAYEQTALIEQDTERNVKIEVKQAWLNLNEANQRITATKGTIEQARTNLERTTLRYRNGLASRLDLDDSAFLLHQAELQFVQAVHDALTALSNLNYAVGKEVITK